MGMVVVTRTRSEIRAEVEEHGTWSINVDDSSKTHGTGSKVHVVEVSAMGREDGKPHPVPVKRFPITLRPLLRTLISPNAC